MVQKTSADERAAIADERAVTTERAIAVERGSDFAARGNVNVNYSVGENGCEAREKVLCVSPCSNQQRTQRRIVQRNQSERIDQ